MFLERLEVAGFGRLSASVDFGPGLTIVTGPNEAGKSTLHQAIFRAFTGFEKSERRRRRGSSDMLDLAPWNGDPYRLVAKLSDVNGRDLRIEWDFAEHAVTVRDSSTAEDLSGEVRGAHDDVALAEFLFGMSAQDYRQVCCLDQITIHGVEPSDTLVAALQRSVESVAGDVGVKDADARLASFLGDRLGVHAGHYGLNQNGALRRSQQRAAVLKEDLEACERQRDEIGQLAMELSLTSRETLVLSEELEASRQQLLRLRYAELRGRLEKVESLTQQAGQRPDVATILGTEQAQLVRTLLERHGAEETAISSLEEAAGVAAPRLEELRRAADELQTKADALAPYATASDDKEAEVRALLERYKAAEEEQPPAPLPIPDADPQLARYRASRAELLTKLSAAPRIWDKRVVGASIALACVATIAGAVLHPALFAGVLLALVLAVMKGRLTLAPDISENLVDYNAASLDELEARLVAEDRERAAAEAANAEAARRASELSDRRETLLGELDALLRGMDLEARGAPAEEAASYLTSCERVRALRDVERDLERTKREIGDVSTPERDFRTRRAELHDLEAGLRAELEACGIHTAELADARAEFNEQQQRSNVAAAQLRAAEGADETLQAVLAESTPEALTTDCEAAEQQLREHVARHGELAAPAGPDEALARAVEGFEQRVGDARERRTRLEAQIEEREQGLAQPALLREELELCEQRIDELELARDAIRLARVTLATAASEAHRAFAPVLNEALERNLPRITDGRYREVAVSEDLDITLVAPETRQFVPASRLSRGTQDQIYLVQRLELSRLLDPTDGGAPLLLDDPFARSDEDRIRLGLELLAEMSEQRQIILLTEDPGVAELAQAAAGPNGRCTVIELEGPGERAPAAPAEGTVA